MITVGVGIPVDDVAPVIHFQLFVVYIGTIFGWMLLFHVTDHVIVIKIRVAAEFAASQ